MITKNFLSKSHESAEIVTPISFNFLFVSLFSPYIIDNSKTFFNTTNVTKKKIVLKESYMILSWFYYLRNITPQAAGKDLRFFVLPVKYQVYTLTRAPIAHKTWSREQFKFHYYFIRISFNKSILVDESLVNFNQILFFILLIKNKLPIFETNLLFLKTLRLLFFVSDKTYFNYRKFDK